MNVYPYKTVQVGKFTKYIISITENGSILVEHYFKNKRKSQTLIEAKGDIKTSNLPKNIKRIVQWASFESRTIANYHKINVDSPENGWF